MLVGKQSSIRTQYMWKKLYLESATCSCENIKYLEFTFDASVIICDEMVNDTNNVSANVPTNVMSTVLTNFHNKNGRYKIIWYILHIVLLMITLLFYL